MPKPSNLHTQLASQVLDFIASRKLPAGSHLPEPELCKHFNVSRTPVRAALKLLMRQGVVEQRPRRGFFTLHGEQQPVDTPLPESQEESLYLQIAEDRVLQNLSAHNSEADLLRRYPVPRGVLVRVLQRLLREGLAEKRPGRGWMFTPVLDSRKMHDESYRFRLALEPLALLERTFALDQRAADQCERQHQRILDGEVRQISSIELFEMNADFHELLAASSGNRFFLQAVQQQNRLRRFVSYHWTYGADRVIETCREHLAVLAAVRDGNLTWAASLLRHHLEVSSSVSPYPGEQDAGSESPDQLIQGAPEHMITLKP